MKVGQGDDLRLLTPRVLIADGEPSQARQAGLALRDAGYSCEVFREPAEALAAIESKQPQIIIADPVAFGLSPSELASRIRATSPEAVLILLVSTPAASGAAAAMRRGAFDYLIKPVNGDELTSVVDRAVEMGGLRRANRLLYEQLAAARMAAAFVAESARSRELAAAVRRAAPARSPVLIEGESGTGKELVAHMLHHWSNHAGGPFVRVGFKLLAAGDTGPGRTGAQAGAFALLKAYADRALGGTLFLDEVAEATPEFQAALLRLLGERPRAAARRDDGGRAAEVRIVVATSRNLAAEAAARRFRADLYFELNVIPIQMPALRERREDIVPLALHFLALHGAETGRSLVLTAEAESALMAHSWPGNVRELEKAIERAVVMGTTDRIPAEALGLSIARPPLPTEAVAAETEQGRAPVEKTAALQPTGEAPPAPEASRAEPEPSPEATQSVSATIEFAEGTLQQCLDRAAALRIKAAIEAAGGNRGAAATALGVDRTTLYRLMRRLGL